MRERGLLLSLFVVLVGCPSPILPTDGGDAAVTRDAPATDVGDASIVGVVTIAPPQASAHRPFAVACLALDATGRRHVIATEATVTVEPTGALEDLGDGLFAGPAIDEVRVRCAIPSLALVDAEGAAVVVGEGAIVGLRPVLDATEIVAGETVNIECRAFDASGSDVVGVAAYPDVEPEAPTSLIGHTSFTTETAGSYEVRCTSRAGGRSEVVTLDVRPALPATITVTAVPETSPVAPLTPVTLARRIHDRFGNLVTDAEVTTTSTPSGETVGDGSFRYAADGTYALEATVTSPTEGGVTLRAGRAVVVDSGGAEITCDPPDGTAIALAAGEMLTVGGSVAEVAGVASLRVNGAVVSVDASGSFSRAVEPSFGANTVVVEATDTTGATTTNLCSYLVAERFVPEGDLVPDAITLVLRPDAIDDRERSAAPSSLADRLVVDLRDHLPGAVASALMLSRTSMVPEACVEAACTAVAGLRAGDTVTLDAADITITPSDGALNIRVVVRGVGVTLTETSSVVSCGTVTLPEMTVDVTLALELERGEIHARIVDESVAVTATPVTTQLDGVPATLIERARGAAGSIRGIVIDALQTEVPRRAWAHMDAQLSTAALVAPPTSLEVPRIGAPGATPIGLSRAVTSLEATASGIRVGLGVLSSGGSDHARPSLGVPVPRPFTFDAPDVPSAVALHASLWAASLHALWRAGHLDVAIHRSVAPSIPADVIVALDPRLAPAVALQSDRIEIGLAAMAVEMTAPALFALPMTFQAGARITATVALDGTGQIVLGALRVEELRLASSVPLTSTVRETVESYVLAALVHLAERALSGALPETPVPVLGEDSSDGRWTFAGASLTTDEQHVIVCGALAR